MVHKVRHAHEFVPVFKDTQVLKEEDNVITRRAMLKEGTMAHVKERFIDEVCTLYAPTKVDFLSLGNHGNFVQNVICECEGDRWDGMGANMCDIADGPNMTDEDLQLTYIFDWIHPDVETGSAEEKAKIEEQKKGAKTAIDMTLKSVRGMIEKGEL